MRLQIKLKRQMHKPPHALLSRAPLPLVGRAENGERAVVFI